MVLDVKQVSHRLGVCEMSIYRYVGNRRLRAKRIGKELFFTTVDLNNFYKPQRGRPRIKRERG